MDIIENAGMNDGECKGKSSIKVIIGAEVRMQVRGGTRTRLRIKVKGRMSMRVRMEMRAQVKTNGGVRI